MVLLVLHSGAVSLPTNASTESTLSAINLKTPSLGQKTTALSAPVCIPSEQIDLLKPPVFQSVIGTVSIANFTPQASSNIYLASQLTIGNWYKVEAVDPETLRAVWVSMGALIGSVEQRPPVGRVFKALNTGSGLSTFSPLIYSENVKVSNTVAVSGTVSTDGLTDAQLRATPVPISGSVGITLGCCILTNKRFYRINIIRY